MKIENIAVIGAMGLIGYLIYNAMKNGTSPAFTPGGGGAGTTIINVNGQAKEGRTIPEPPKTIVEPTIIKEIHHKTKSYTQYIQTDKKSGKKKYVYEASPVLKGATAQIIKGTVKDAKKQSPGFTTLGKIVGIL